MKKSVFVATSVLCASLLAVFVATAVENEDVFIETAPIKTVHVSVVPNPDFSVITIIEDTVKSHDTPITYTANLWEIGHDGTLFRNGSASLSCDSTQNTPQWHFSTDCLTERNHLEHSTKPERFLLMIPDDTKQVK